MKEEKDLPKKIRNEKRFVDSLLLIKHLEKTKEEPQYFVIKIGWATEAEVMARIDAIVAGKEPLPDGSKWQPSDEIEFLSERMLKEILGQDPFEPEYFKGSKQLLDIILRPIEKEDLQLPLTPGTVRQKIEIAIQGGLNSVDLTFEEKKILHAIEAAFSDAGHPDEIELTRASLYDHMGVEWRPRPNGSRYRAEAGGYQRRRIDRTLLALSDKPFPFTFKMKSGKLDKKTGEPLWTVALTRTPIVKVSKIYEDVKQMEIPGIARQQAAGEKRFSHYLVRLNKYAVGEIEHYFRYLPRLLAKSISDFRLSMGGRATTAELNFIEYLFTESREVLEINFLKLAKKLKVKRLSRPEEARSILSRCYETAKALGYLLGVQEDRPALRGTKEIIHLNPARFKYLRNALPPGQEASREGED